MNTTNILLGTTSLLIVVAFALSFGGFSKDRNSPESQEEMAELKETMEQMKAETEALRLRHLRATSPAYTPPTTPPPLPIAPGPVAAQSDVNSEEMAALKAKIDALEKENDGLARENEEVFAQESEESIRQKMAAKRIDMAMDMGKVVSADKARAIVIYEPSAAAPGHQPGMVLAIRRNSGIVGTIVIDRQDPSGQYIATMRPHGYSPDGYPDIQPGDTIIRDPNS